MESTASLHPRGISTSVFYTPMFSKILIPQSLIGIPKSCDHPKAEGESPRPRSFFCLFLAQLASCTSRNGRTRRAKSRYAAFPGLRGALCVRE